MKTSKKKYITISIFILLFIFSVAPHTTEAQAQSTGGFWATVNGAWTWVADGTAANYQAVSQGLQSHPVTSLATGFLAPAAYDIWKANSDKAAANSPDANPDAIFCWRSNPTRTGGSVGLPNEVSIPGCLAIFSYTILYLSSWVLWVAALFFDYTIQFSLSMRNVLGGFAAIQYGWETFRNLINLLFILILVYIAIATILQVSGYGYKQLLGKLVVAAVLINFSMFFTEIIIDGSNIVTLTFYKQIMDDAKRTSGGNATYNQSVAGSAVGASQTASEATNQWLSFGIMNALGLSSVWGAVGKGSTSTDPQIRGNDLTAAALTADGSTAPTPVTNPWTMMLVGFGGSVFVLIMAFVFFAAAIMFMGRLIMLIFLIITSPVAFAARVLPKTSTYAGKWWSKLNANVLFAPVYMAMMFVTLRMVWGSTNKTKNLLQMFANGGTHTGIQAVVFFVLLCAMLVACLVVATSFSTMGAKTMQSWGKSAGTWGKNFAKRRAFAPVSWAADKAAKNKLVARYTPNLLLPGLDKLAQAKVGGSSYRSRIEDDKKKYLARGDLIKKVVTGELIRGKNETVDDFKARKLSQEKAGKNAQKDFLGVGTKKGENEGNNVSRWWSKGKQLARQDIMDKDVKSQTSASVESVTKIQKDIHKDLEDLRDDIKDLDTGTQEAIEKEFGTGNDKGIFNTKDPKDLKRGDIAKLVDALVKPLREIENQIKANDREMTKLNREKAMPGKSMADKNEIDRKLTELRLKTDILNGDKRNTQKTLEKMEKRTSKWQQIDMAQGTKEAIEESKPKAT